ncbi:MAG: xanthine dehydrogenase small subunit [Crocinitomicaceae bacterium]|jgi:xanthine dehydrogenase small subunit
MIRFILNNELIKTDLPSGSLLLDFVRYRKALTGTKIGCREGDCGACTMLIGTPNDSGIDYLQVTSCLTPLGNVHGKHAVTIEGLNMDELSPVQQHMINESGTQCGFCTVGFVVSLSGFCMANKAATYQEAIAAIDGNICRCTGYKSIERAALNLTKDLAQKSLSDPLNWLIENKFIPNYFSSIPKRLNDIGASKTEETGRYIGGGTDLYVQQHLALVDHNAVHISNLAHLKFIRSDKNTIHIGGATTVTEFLESTEIQGLFPNLWAHVKLVSSSPIRNISTFAGNFVNASPIGDFTAFFIALDASITLKKDTNERIIKLKSFYKGYKYLDLQEGELISSISFEAPAPTSQFNLEKVSKRIHLDIATVNTAVLISVAEDKISEIHVSAGGVGPIPIYLEKTRAFLLGKEISSETIKSANEVMQGEVSPISDVRGTQEYKRLLLRQLFYAHFVKLFPSKITLKDLV